MPKVIKQPKTECSVFDMKDGELAIITDWSVKGYVGVIVQRYGDDLVKIGDKRGMGWSDLLTTANLESLSKTCKVQILPAGTVIEL